jgi:chromosome segregation ATPase
MPTIHVKNFQSIKDASLEVKGFTAITGPNNSGKTALMRAVRGVFQNTPGTAFVRHGESESAVTVTFDDAAVTWKKGNSSRSKPTYIVNGSDPIYPGREVPDVVRDLGVLPIKAGGNEVWPTLAPQFTGQVFMLDRPGSHLAEAVADIERVSKLNTALKQSDKEKRSASSELRIRRKDMTKAEDGLSLFDGLDGVLGGLELLAEKRAKIQRVSRTHQRLTGMRDQLVGHRKVATFLAPVEEVVVPGPQQAQGALSELGMAEALYRRLRAAKGALAALEGVAQVATPQTDAARLLRDLDEAETTQGRLTAARVQVARLSTLGEVGNPSEITASKLSRAVVKVSGMAEQLGRAEADLEVVAVELAEADLEAQSLASEVQRLIEELGVCPTCGKEHT